MGYVARQHLKWGDGTIAPGEPVPDEEGRNYASLLRLGQIAEVKEAEEMSDAELAEAYEALKAEHAALVESAKALADEVAELREQPAETETETPGDAADAESTGDGESESDGDLPPDPAPPVDDDLLSKAKPLGGGYYELPDGSKVRGRAAVEKALADAESTGDGE